MLKVICSVLLMLLTTQVFASGNIPDYEARQLMVQKKAPNFTLPLASGGMKSFSDMSEGKKTILFFWASWCPHCHNQLAKLTRDKDIIRQKGIAVVLVDLGETMDEVRAFINASHLEFDTFVDANNDLQEVYQIMGMPTLFFINEQGIIRNITHGLPDDYDAAF